MPIPAGVIAIWRGTIADIPAGWDLCDGSGGRPNLLSKFLRSVPAATEPGGEGGSDTHTHIESGTGGAHNHGGTSGSGGAHQHTTPTTTGSHYGSSHGTKYITNNGEGHGSAVVAGGSNHNHTWTNDSHTHPIDTKNHTHTFQNADTRPAYYQVAFIYCDGSPLTFAEGIITLWSNVLGNIPIGWALDVALVAKFLRSVPAVTDPGGVGGADSHAHTQNAGGTHTHSLSSSHSHTSNLAGSHSHGISRDASTGTYGYGGTTNAGNHTHNSSLAGSHTHTAVSTGSHSHTVNIADGRPPYHELAPIDADAGGADHKVGLICIWTGTIANIPANWDLCDGNGGRPNLLSKFIRGVATAGTNPGGVGGNLTHTHTVQNAGNHAHASVSSAGEAHSHSCLSSSWYHNHTRKDATADSHKVMGYSNYGPSHNHGNLSGGPAHSDHTVAIASGDHSDHTYGTASSLPAYYEVAFIYCTSVLVAYEKTLTESLGLTDKVVKAPALLKTEPLGLVDTYSKTWAAYRIHSEILGLSDTVIKAPALIKTESLGLLDSIAITKALHKVLSELLGLSDTVKKDATKVLTEDLGLVDTYSRIWATHQTYSELLGLADTISKGVVQHPLIEALGLSDTVVKEPSKVLKESLGLLEVYSRTWTAHKTYTELLGLLDTIQKATTLHPLTESLGLVDTVVKSSSITKDELLGLKGSIIKDTSVTRTELLGLLDTITKAVSLPLPEILGLLDTYTDIWTAKRTFTEALGLEDRLSKHVSLHALTEVLGLLDSVSYGKNLSTLPTIIRKYLQLEEIEAEEANLNELLILKKIVKLLGDM